MACDVFYNAMLSHRWSIIFMVTCWQKYQLVFHAVV